jgi:hypothetical protein
MPMASLRAIQLAVQIEAFTRDFPDYKVDLMRTGGQPHHTELLPDSREALLVLADVWDRG